MVRFWLRATRAGVLLVVLALAACSPTGPATPAASTTQVDLRTQLATIHKSPTCECCAGHEAHLADAGFPTRSQEHDDVGAWKEAAGVPRELGSCHTTAVGGYLVEGHVPAETIVRLLEERPDFDGIALPGMPSGSPGMGGLQDEPWVIHAFVDGETTGVFETR